MVSARSQKLDEKQVATMAALLQLRGAVPRLKVTSARAREAEAQQRAADEALERDKRALAAAAAVLGAAVAAGEAGRATAEVRAACVAAAEHKEQEEERLEALRRRERMAELAATAATAEAAAAASQAALDEAKKAAQLPDAAHEAAKTARALLARMRVLKHQLGRGVGFAAAVQEALRSTLRTQALGPEILDSKMRLAARLGNELRKSMKALVHN